MNYGLVRKIIPEEEKYVFGSALLPQNVIQPDGKWIEFLPDYEPQSNNNFDTSACTIFGTVNIVEILEKRIFGIERNYAERFHYNLIPVRPPGGDPHAAAESIRKCGMVDQDLLPMTETFDEYVKPEPMPRDLIDLGSKWVEKRDFGHEWLWRGNLSPEGKIALLRQALKYSPVGISVTAWHINQDGLYEDKGMPNNHWVPCIDIVDIDGRPCPKIFDSYDHEIKVLSPDHHIEIAKRYHLTEKVYNERKGLFAFIKNLIKKFI